MATLAVILGKTIRQNVLFTNGLLRYICISNVRCQLENKSADDFVTLYESEGTELNLDEKLRNVSGLRPNQYKQYHGLPPDLPYQDLYRRKLRVAQYGTASGEDPRILWPSRAQLRDQKKEEIEERCGNLSARLQEIQANKIAIEKEKMERRKAIEKKMSEMPKLIAEYKNKQVTAEKEKKAKAAKKQLLLDEARDYFGYKIKANDPKFAQMLAEKEEKEKKEAKKLKKEEKKKKLASLQIKEV
ncbi:large ribosomal subunit protein mL64-like [Physella acuta]|uniref:large ribosomal subunit protein mL64-like n=1 Tax=Physella acuta TaxID=109671 RepID=UPI0027DB8A4C|nr:large ribosomal subunit protein mL64-like [Physella acuta]